MRLRVQLSARSRVAFGQVGLMTSILLICDSCSLGSYLTAKALSAKVGLPLAEAIAMHVHGLISESNPKRLAAALSTLVQRNPDLVSAGVRLQDGDYLVSVGEHQAHWNAMSGNYSTDSQIRVPLLVRDQTWGEVELRFKPHLSLHTFAHSETDSFHSLYGLYVLGVFYAYLSQMLKHLDPTRAVPPRVRAALDTLAEGLMVLDMKGEIVLANQAFADTVQRDVDDLMGISAWELPWRGSDGAMLPAEDTPWMRCLAEGKPIRKATVLLQDEGGHRNTFQVNCSPVMADRANTAVH